MAQQNKIYSNGKQPTQFAELQCPDPMTVSAVSTTSGFRAFDLLNV
jgi:hypothetical protein